MKYRSADKKEGNLSAFTMSLTRIVVILRCNTDVMLTLKSAKVIIKLRSARDVYAVSVSVASTRRHFTQASYSIKAEREKH